MDVVVFTSSITLLHYYTTAITWLQKCTYEDQTFCADPVTQTPRRCVNAVGEWSQGCQIALSLPPTLATSACSAPQLGSGANLATPNEAIVRDALTLRGGGRRKELGESGCSGHEGREVNRDTRRGVSSVSWTSEASDVSTFSALKTRERARQQKGTEKSSSRISCKWGRSTRYTSMRAFNLHGGGGTARN